MTSDLILLGVVWLFWTYIIVELARKGKCWIPVPLFVPLALSTIGLLTNAIFPPWGTILISGLHALLLLCLATFSVLIKVENQMRGKEARRK